MIRVQVPFSLALFIAIDAAIQASKRPKLS